MLTNSHESALGKVLLQNGLLSETELNNAFELAKKQKQNLLLYILQNFPISSLSISEACAFYFGLPHRQLMNYPRENLSLSIIDKEIIQRYQVIPLQQQEQQLFIAIADPDEFSVLEDIQYQTGLHTQAIMTPYDQLTQLINRLLSSQHYLNQNEDTQAVEFVEHILTDSVHRQASDIHFEPLADHYRVRLRIDGLLHEITQTPAHSSHSIISRLKILAQCDISEKRLPQDGRFTFTTLSGYRRDCRLSTCPSVFGEKIVIRLLEANQKILAMNELGLEQQDQDKLTRALSQPQGLILVTGPTGSGKTITLYTALAHLNRKTVNISTAEEPVEITLPGVNQVNVHEKAGLNFATVLRAFLRQDPDIIMVGEIRDRETAEIAVRAAQTGHLVLSTLHTNSAADTVTRLLNMGIAPYNISSSLLLVIAQRLVRKLCLHCKPALTQDHHSTRTQAPLIKMESVQKWAAPSFNEAVQARACSYCIEGYQGREGVFELMPISKNLRSLILQGNREDIFHQAQQEGMLNLWQAALQKVQEGITSLEEINRVIGHEDAF